MSCSEGDPQPQHPQVECLNPRPSTSKSPTCSLCCSHHKHTGPVSSWESTAACEFILSRGFTQQDLICRPCRQDVNRVLGDPNYTPRWEKKGIDSCCIAQCTERVFSSYTMSDDTQPEYAMEKCGFQCKEDPIPTPTPLCTHHYHATSSNTHQSTATVPTVKLH